MGGCGRGRGGGRKERTAGKEGRAQTGQQGPLRVTWEAGSAPAEAGAWNLRPARGRGPGRLEGNGKEREPSGVWRWKTPVSGVWEAGRGGMKGRGRGREGETSASRGARPMPSFLGQETQTAVAFCPDSPPPPPPPRQGAGAWNSGISGGWTAYRFFTPEDRPGAGNPGRLSGCPGLAGTVGLSPTPQPPPTPALLGQREGTSHLLGVRGQVPAPRGLRSPSPLQLRHSGSGSPSASLALVPGRSGVLAGCWGSIPAHTVATWVLAFGLRGLRPGAAALLPF